MAETKILSTKTIINIASSAISIYTYYQDEAVKAITAFISELAQTIGGISFKEGEGGITTDNVDDVFYIDSNNEGNLVVTGDNAEDYFLDEDTGQLYYYE